MKRKGSFKLCLVIGLILVSSMAYAVEDAELKSELEKAYQELKATDPEVAQEFVREYQEAVKSGEIAVERADTEAIKESGEKGFVEGEGRHTEADSRKMETEFNALLKEGKNPQEAEKIMREKYGEPERGPGPDFDLSKPEERAKALERFDKDSEHLKAAGLSDDDLKSLKDAIARGDGDAADRIFEKVGPPDMEGRGPGDFERFGRAPLGDEHVGPGGFDRGPQFEPGDAAAKDWVAPQEGSERYGRPEGGEHYGPESGREYDKFSKDDMFERVTREMGREPTAQEKEMMERDFERYGEGPSNEYHGPEDRAELERYGPERPEFDRPEFDRPEFERPEFERPEYERPEREPLSDEHIGPGPFGPEPPPPPEPPPAP